MKVASVMSKGVISVGPKAPIDEVVRIIFKRKVNSLPVVDEKKKLLGIITRENILERMYPDYRKIFLFGERMPDFDDIEKDITDRISGMTVQKLMTKNVVYARATTPVMRALSRMIVRRVNQLPVLSETGVLVGMITKGDVFYSLFMKKK